MKVAIVHYWLVKNRGGEKVLELINSIFPDADIFTNVYSKSFKSNIIRKEKVKTTFIQQLPFASKLYKYYLPLMPLALEHIDLSEYDLVISSESGPAKGVITSPNCVHICYCHTPMRYLWDLERFYQSEKKIFNFIKKYLFFKIRQWDFLSAQRPDIIIANSSYVQKRVKKYWKRECIVINPPFTPFIQSGEKKKRLIDDDYYLYVGELVKYKGVELLVDAFNKNHKRLVIVGSGDEEKKLKSKANSNITFMKYLDNNDLLNLYENSNAFVYAGIEDFGIVFLESLSVGKPVICYKLGGVTDIIEEDVNGIFFLKNDVKSINEAIRKFENLNFDQNLIIQSVDKFSVETFKANFSNLIEKVRTSND